jgi:hypothetical protein
MSWRGRLRADPLGWLLAEDIPAVRAAALQRLGDQPADAAKVQHARAAAMAVEPIRSILAAQDPAGWWAKPGLGYRPKYRGTVWQLIFLDQLGADPDHPPRSSPGGPCLRLGAALVPDRPRRVRLRCGQGRAATAALGGDPLPQRQPAAGPDWLRPPGGPPCVEAAIGWAARAITGEGVDRWYASSTSGPGFACAANQHRPCARGALKERNALTRIPARAGPPSGSPCAPAPSCGPPTGEGQSAMGPARHPLPRPARRGRR